MTVLKVLKPLMWERLKLTPRFRFVNTSQVIHIVVDQSVGAESGTDDVW